uniref:Uncharacterized protein n=1 Tax=Timema poppense TaxID=170557 RepID=A0A7R9DNJ3_TIMPO|nr:unnamed protein product [Timema poppensis]
MDRGAVSGGPSTERVEPGVTGSKISPAYERASRTAQKTWIANGPGSRKRHGWLRKHGPRMVQTAMRCECGGKIQSCLSSERPSSATSSMAEPHLSMETLVTQGLYNPFDEDFGHLNNGGGQILNTDSCQNIISDLPSRNMVHILGDESNRKHVTMRRPKEYRSLPHETQADKIVSELEKDTELMEDNPVSEQLRMETLREMPESLTMKRIIKKRLKTASQNSKHRPISLWKRFKYRLSMSWTKFNLTIKTVLYSFELWYSSLKVIEGHFGSSVATYFRFLRWLFILNTIVLVLRYVFAHS